MSSQPRNFFDSYARGAQEAQQYTTSSSSVSRVQTGHSTFEARKAEFEGEKEAILRFSQDNLVVASGSSDYSKIATLKDAIL